MKLRHSEVIDLNAKESRIFEEKIYGAIGTSDCHKVGIMGGCGLDCWVYQKGKCPVPDEMISRFETEEDRENHSELYGS